jgi:Arc/MetJ-type ribon-helix-helix transcriptional regulator
MVDMAQRTTVVLTEEDERALRKASRAQGVSQSELIRRGIRMVTASHRSSPRPSAGWLKLTRTQRRSIDRDDFGDPDD